MNIKGMSVIQAAAGAFVIAMSVAADAGAQPASAQNKYTDDAIVRDLKAGKLTVHEAQILQARNDHAAVKPATGMARADAPKTSAKTAHAAHPATAVKSVKSGKLVKTAKKKGKVPVRHLNAASRAHAEPHPKPHARHVAKAAKAAKAVKRPATSHHARPVHAKTAAPVNKADKAASKKTEPVRKTAVKYIR